MYTTKHNNFISILVYIYIYILISSVLVNTYVQGERDVQIVILLTLEKEYLNAHNLSRPIMRKKMNCKTNMDAF